MARSVRPLRFVVAVVVVALVALGLSGCVADPPPTMGTATPGNAQATVTWQPPLAAPAPITGYVVTPWIGFARQTPVVFNSAATTQTVTGLTNGVTYTFTVHAVNARGDDSAESGMSNPVTPVSPIGQEFPVSDPVYGPNRHPQSAQTVAFDGTNYLVVWTDQRNVPYNETWGARVAPDGTVLDPTGIRIAQRGGGPDVSFDGTNYLVVWGNAQGVEAVRVSTSGVVLDQTPIQINANVNTQTVPAVATGNGSSLIVWLACEPAQCDLEGQSTYEVVAARIASDGTVLDPTPVTIAQMVLGSYLDTVRPDVAFDGTDYLVAFARIAAFSPTIQYGIGVREVSGAGVPLGNQNTTFVGSLSSPVAPSLSFDGTNFFLAWSGQSPGVRGMRISPDPFVPLDPSGFGISTAAGWGAAVTFDGTNTLVAWEGSSGTMLARRIDGQGTPVDPSPIPVPGVTGAGLLALAADNGQVLLAFTTAPSPSNVINAVRIDSGTILDNPPFPVSAQADDQTDEAIVPAPTGSFVVWGDRWSPGDDIHGARVQDGSMVDGTGLRISTAPNGQADGSPAVAFDGTDYFVVWSRYGGVYGTDIYGARVTADGVVLDPGGIQITNTPTTRDTNPSVAFDGTNYLVVWDGTGVQSQSGVSAARVSTNGTVLDPGGVVLTTTYSSSDPTVAFGGGSYFVTWQTANGSGPPDIAGERVGTDGTVLDAAPLAISHRASYSEALPQIAFDGTNFLVVWEDQRNSSATDIYGARVSPAGALLDPSGLAISTASNLQTTPHVAANGDGHFFVIWRDTRDPNANSPDIYGARVSDAGVVLDPSGVAIANDNRLFNPVPTVAPNAGPGSWEVAYPTFVADPPYGSFRAFHRSVTLN